MTTNTYFRSNYAAASDQQLAQDLIVESIKIYGQNMYYIPREQVAFDQLYGEDKLSAFNNPILLEFYIDSFQGFTGERDIIAKFGLEIRDELILTVARSRFNVEVKAKTGILRPREGDLIFFPVDQSLFEITFCEDEQVFHQLGRLYTYELSLKRFELAAEQFNTGITAIDRYDKDFGIDTMLILGTGTGEFQAGETVTQAPSTTAEVAFWDPISQQLTLIKRKGEFVAGTNIIGQTSHANWTFPGTEEKDAKVRNTDNSELDTLASTSVDTAEKNPYNAG